MKGKGANKNKFVYIITLPFRALGKARDFYVRKVTECGQHVTYGGGNGGFGSFGNLPRSFSTASSRSNNDEDYAELVRAASVRTLKDQVGIDMLVQREQLRQGRMAAREPKGVPRSVSVGIGMGRIDEEKPFESVELTKQIEDLKNGNKKNGNGLLYPRSKSYDVTKGSVMF